MENSTEAKRIKQEKGIIFSIIDVNIFTAAFIDLSHAEALKRKSYCWHRNVLDLSIQVHI